MLVVLVSVAIGYVLRGLVDWTGLRSRAGLGMAREQMRIAARAEAERIEARGGTAGVLRVNGEVYDVTERVNGDVYDVVARRGTSLPPSQEGSGFQDVSAGKSSALASEDERR